MESQTITTLADVITNYGIMVVISIIVVIFVNKSFKSYFKKDELINNSILPELKLINTAILESKRQILELLTNHNSNFAYKNNITENTLEKIIEDIRELIKKIDELKSTIENFNNSHELIIQKYNATLADLKVGCPVICDRDMLIKEMISKGYASKEQIDEIIKNITEYR